MFLLQLKMGHQQQIEKTQITLDAGDIPHFLNSYAVSFFFFFEIKILCPENP